MRDRVLLLLALAALVGACFGQVEPESSNDRGSPSASADASCSYVKNNPPECPENYGRKSGDQPCPWDGLVCVYPGRGDSKRSDGCISDATLSCRRRTLRDGGKEAEPEWVAMQ